MRFVYYCKGCGSPAICTVSRDLDTTSVQIQRQTERCEEPMYAENKNPAPPFLTELVGADFCKRPKP